MTTITQEPTQAAQVVLNTDTLQAMIQQVMQGNTKTGNHPWSADPSGLFAGDKQPMTYAECFSEYMMNWYDLSNVHNGREITGHIYSEVDENKKLKSYIIRDDGPGFPTDSPVPFMETFLKLHAKNKLNDPNSIGDAGVGAKEATGWLGSHWVFTWSDGKGKKATAIFDKETFTEPDKYHFNNDAIHSGGSFFEIKISNLNRFGAPSELRNELCEKFASKLNTHPAVKIYLTNPSLTSKLPLIADDQLKFVDKTNLREEFIVDYNSARAKVVIGLSDYSGPKGNWNTPRLRILRYGIIHQEKNNSPAHQILFPKTSFSWTHRNIFISIDCDALEPTRVKNDFIWEDERTKTIIEMIGKDDRFLKMVSKCMDHNQNQADDKSKSKQLTAAEDEHLKKMAARAAEKFGQIVIDRGYKSHYTTSDDIQEIIKKGKKLNVSGKKKNGKNNATQSNSSNKISNSSTVKGNKYTFTISYVPLEESITRYHMEINNGVIALIVNESYAGRDKIKTNNTHWPEFLYVADTMGIAIQDFLLREKLTVDDPIKEPDWDYLCSVRESVVSDCLDMEYKS